MLTGGNLSGKEAMAILVEEIGIAIGKRRLAELDRKTRDRLHEQGKSRGTFRDWLRAIAEVIVQDGDKRADEGFQNAIRRIRATAARK